MFEFAPTQSAVSTASNPVKREPTVVAKAKEDESLRFAAVLEEETVDHKEAPQLLAGPTEVDEVVPPDDIDGVEVELGKQPSKQDQRKDGVNISVQTPNVMGTGPEGRAEAAVLTTNARTQITTPATASDFLNPSRVELATGPLEKPAGPQENAKATVNTLPSINIKAPNTGVERLPIDPQMFAHSNKPTDSPSDRAALYPRLSAQSATPVTQIKSQVTPQNTNPGLPVITAPSGLESLVREIDGVAVAAAPITSQLAGTIVPQAAANLQGYAPQAAQQIAQAAIQAMPGRTEIALNPQELGRVRIAISTVDGGVAVSILAERPETTDLMRRNIDILAREFRDLGYESAQFSFDEGTGGANQNTSDDDSDQVPHSQFMPPPEQSVTAETVIVRAGLDLKL